MAVLELALQPVHIWTVEGVGEFTPACSCGWRSKILWAVERYAVEDAENHVFSADDTGDLLMVVDYHQRYWTCPDCGCLERAESAFCYRCGAGPDEDDG